MCVNRNIAPATHGHMPSNFKNDAKLLLEAKQNIITGRPAKAKATNKRAVLGQLFPQITLCKKEDSPSHQNVGTCMKY
jgi:hypothetical protein